jgi:cbb3-type cytochrome oxidase subunit 3
MLEQAMEIWWLILGIILFVGIVLYVFRRGAKKKYQEDAKIPLRKD